MSPGSSGSLSLTEFTDKVKRFYSSEVLQYKHMLACDDTTKLETLLVAASDPQSCRR
jgi:hypothetical protein